MKNYVFCFPYKEVGGVSILFLSIANYLNESGISVYLLDYEDGYMFKNANGIRCISYIENKSINIPNNSTLIFQAMTPWRFLANLRGSDLKYLFWHLHPFNMIPNVPKITSFVSRHPKYANFLLKGIFNILTSDSLEFLFFLYKRKAIYFMDNENHQIYNNLFNIKLAEPIYLPVPTPTFPYKNTITQRSLNFENKTLKYCWLGRIVDFKFHTLYKTLCDLNFRANRDIIIEFDIIGDGDMLSNLQLITKSFSNIKISFLGILEGAPLVEKLKEQNVLFAMGTSALIGGSMAIPTICLDFCYESMPPNTKYNWLFNSKNFNLGQYIPFINTEQRCTIDEIVHQTIHDYENLSSSTYKYCEKNHSIKNISKLLIENLESNATNYQELVTQKFFYYKHLHTAYHRIKSIVHN